MAIAYDTTSTSSAKASTITATHSASGSDRAVVVIATGVRNNDSSWTWDDVTYDSVSMTLQQSIGSSPQAGRYMTTELWTLLNPTTGSVSVEASCTEVLLSSSLAVISVTGVSAVGDSNSDNGVGTAATVTATTTAENSWLIGGVTASEQASATGTPGTGVTERWDFEAAGDYAVDDHNSMGGHRAATTTGAYAFAYTTPTSDDWYALVVELTPVPTAPASDAVGADLITNNLGVNIYG